MKHYYLLIAFLLATLFTNAQVVTIPDANFKTALLNHTNPIVDTNGDGEIQVSEAQMVPQLSLNNKNISDLTGIEAFVNLVSLSCMMNNLTSLDFSQNPDLENLQCSTNYSLVSLNVSQNAALKELHCYFNEISELDVTNCPLLEELDISVNNLNGLDVTQNPSLNWLVVSNTNIDELDVSQNPLLEYLLIENNNLSNIDLSNQPVLTELYIGGNDLSNIDLSNQPLLTKFGIARNNIQNLDLSQNLNLEDIDVSYNLLNELNVGFLTNLERATVYGNDFETLDFSNNGNLNWLELGNENLLSYSVANNGNLETLEIRNASSLNSIDLSLNVNLKQFFIENTFNIPTLDLSSNVQLIVLSVKGTSFQELDLSNNEDLHSVNIQNNEFLEYVNFKNGYNYLIDNEVFQDPSNIVLISTFRAKNNPNLNFICVDDIDFAMTMFNTSPSELDSTITFLENCSLAGSSNTFTGTINYDENSNGCDNSDPVVNNFLVNSNDGINDFTTSVSESGEYILNVVENTYITGVLNVPDYFTVSPQTSTHTFVGYDNQEQLDFCITANQSVADLNITLLPINQARPGFESNYQLVIENMGTQTAMANVSLSFDENSQSFVTATPSETSSTANELTFEVNNLPPFGQQVIDFTMQTFQPPVVNGGDVLNFTAEVTPNTNDYTPEDNTFVFDQIVVNSYDPNDKQVLQGSQVLIDDADQYLDYLIRFQNTGTASAINVRVVDTLHPNLDYSTLKPVNASDNYRVEIINGNHVAFIFDNINLPHESADGPGSHGFIAYKIKPKNDVVVGDVVTGDAKIYFDYNAPIITNMVSTEFVDELGVNNVNSTENTVIIYPNPTSSVLNLQPNKGIILESVTLYNLQGSELLHFNKKMEQLNLEKLSSGVYILTIKTDRGILNKQLIKK